jgi:hypothetical protein
VRKKMVAVRGPCRSGCGAIITQCSTRDLGGPFRRPQAGFIDLWVWMGTRQQIETACAGAL